MKWQGEFIDAPLSSVIALGRYALDWSVIHDHEEMIIINMAYLLYVLGE